MAANRVVNGQPRPADAATAVSTVHAAPRSTSSVKPRRLLLARSLVVLVGVLAPLLMLEVALRLFGPILPGNYDTGHYLERHARLGHFNVPNFDGWIKTRE